MAIAIDRIGDTKDRLGESPVWSAREGCLYWADSLAGLLHRLHLESGRREAFAVPAPIGSFGLCRGGGAVLALRDGFYRYDFAASSVTPTCAVISGGVVMTSATRLPWSTSKRMSRLVMMPTSTPSESVTGTPEIR